MYMYAIVLHHYKMYARMHLYFHLELNLCKTCLIQWSLSIKDLRIEDISLIRTLPVVPATHREVYQITSEIRTPL